MTTIRIPKLSLVVLVGVSGSGKSTFAHRHFAPTEVLSSDTCRGWVSDDENSQEATPDAFDVLHYVAGVRLKRGNLTVVDATNVQPEARRPLVQLARSYHALPVAIVLKVPEQVCRRRNRERDDRDFGDHVITNQYRQLRRSLKKLRREGFRHIFVLDSVEAIEAATIERVPLWNDRRDEHGPFDIIGDVHGCCDELEQLLGKLGYVVEETLEESPLARGPVYVHPDGRKVVFLGDLVDRGPRILDTLSLVRNMVIRGSALCVPGNHDMKLVRKLRGRDVQITYGLAETLTEIEDLSDDCREAFKKEAHDFLDGLVSHYLLDEGHLVVAHAGMLEQMQGRGSGKVRDFALYGQTTGETDEFGLPVRIDWAAEYRGKATVVYGHTPTPEPEWLNGTMNIDTGCVFGGRLTALRYPEKEVVSVEAARQYCAPAKPFLEETVSSELSAQQSHDDLLHAEDVTGKLLLQTGLDGKVTIREGQSAAALEVMSRFAADPKWLIYLPPTMSPCETSGREGYLEHPEEAFAYFRSRGVPEVICQKKHMGSRAVVIVVRSPEVVLRRFGIDRQCLGTVLTRTGRQFFDDDTMEQALLGRLAEAMERCGFWDSLQTDWACLDCELMPWSAKALELLKGQYAAVAAAGTLSVPAAEQVLARTASRDDLQRDVTHSKKTSTSIMDVDLTLARMTRRRECLGLFRDAYRRYCWSVETLTDLSLAPFHVLATEGAVHVDKDHAWHMDRAAGMAGADEEVLLATPYRRVDLSDPRACQEATDWWMELTGSGGEGMVVKPMSFVARGGRGLLQPAVKVRGREYLRIIYGPEYTEPENLERLRHRRLGRKRSMALREFALGVESLHRFVRGEPLRRVHECAFGVLALESEPVDPRL